MSLSIHQRFIFLSLLPLTVIALVLGVFFVKIQMSHIEDSLAHRGQNIARHLASASSYSLTTNNIEQLAPIAQSILDDDEVQSIVIINNEGEVLFRSHAADPESGHLNSPVMDKDKLIFMKPIFQAHTGKSQPPDIMEDPVPIGWSIVELSKDETRQLQYLSLKEGALFILLLLAVSFVLIYRISKTITSPIVKITQAANQIEQGNFDVQLDTGASSELVNLQKSIKNMAASLKKSRHELQEEINHATTNLISSLQVVEKKNKQLFTARQQAVMANRVKSEFLANMSHEIRTPMNGILGFVKLLRKTNPSSQQMEHIDTIEKSANNLLAIINDILDISKIESGKIRIQNESYNLRDCVEEVLSLLAPSAYEKQLNLVGMIYSDVPLNLYGDAAKVRQMLTNLVSNAIKFTERGNVIVRTMLENEYESKTKIKISVSDTGIGISPKDQNRLFNTFEQVDSSSTRKFGGTGLGLAISKSLAELMQGEIGLHSEPAKGSTFWFTFLHEPIKLSSKSQSYQQTNSPSLAGYNALLYDANEATLLALSHLCDEWEIFFDTANTIEEVYKKIKTAEKNAPYDFIVLGLSYHQALLNRFTETQQRIRKLTRTNLVCLINSADTDDISRFISLGANAVLSKPVKSHELHNKLRSLLIPNSEIFDYQRLSQADLEPVHQKENLARHSEHLTDDKLNGLHILVAEDNEINAKLVNSMLQQHGAHITMVGNGDEAIAACETQQFDIVLMDIHMPKTNGVEATKRIRAHQTSCKSMPIVALTADAMADDQLAFIEAGMNDVMIKPVNEELLVNKILYLTNKQATDHSAEELSPPTTTTAKSALKSGPGAKETTSLSSKSASSKGASKDNKLAGEIMGLLIKELPAFKQSIQTSHQQGNYDSLYQHVHKLHGALSYCDLPKIKPMIQKIERDLKLNRRETLALDLNALFQELDELIQHIKQ
jgi:two-component system sensor histidine kinase BarA